VAERDLCSVADADAELPSSDEPDSAELTDETADETDELSDDAASLTESTTPFELGASTCSKSSSSSSGSSRSSDTVSLP